MTRSASVSLLGPEFNDFLFAPIGEDRNKTLLSVLSALARLDLDPWQEAAKLARLPVEAATQRLASLIAKLPEGSSADGDSATIAARLILLLPRRSGPDASLPDRALDLGAVANSRTFIYVMLMALVLGAFGLMANHQPSTTADDADKPASVSELPIPPTSSIQ
jgi:hypothetical protein